MYSSLAATIYIVWQERNNAIWNMHIRSVHNSVERIKLVVKKRNQDRLPKKLKASDGRWFDRL